MFRKIAPAIGLLMLFGVMSQASATTILDTINGDTFTVTPGWTVSTPNSNQSVALAFTPASALTITNITAYIGLVGPSGSVDFGIMTDSSGLPSGTFLFDQVISLSEVNPIILSSLSVPVSGGTTYWLAAIPIAVTDGAWQWNQNLSGLFATGPGNTWTETPFDFAPEVLISANELVAPLPAALPMFLGGAGLIGLLARRRKRKTAAIAA